MMKAWIDQKVCIKYSRKVKEINMMELDHEGWRVSSSSWDQADNSGLIQL